MAGKKDLGKLFCDIALFTDMVNRLALLAGNNLTARLSESISKELPLEERLCLDYYRYKDRRTCLVRLKVAATGRRQG